MGTKRKKQAGYVYVLVNEQMPGIVKIGSTQKALRQRLSLHNANLGIVPHMPAYTMPLAVVVEDCHDIEQQMHLRFDAQKIRGGSQDEFFRINLDEVRDALEDITGEEVEDVSEHSQPRPPRHAPGYRPFHRGSIYEWLYARYPRLRSTELTGPLDFAALSREMFAMSRPRRDISEAPHPSFVEAVWRKVCAIIMREGYDRHKLALGEAPFEGWAVFSSPNGSEPPGGDREQWSRAGQALGPVALDVGVP